MSDDYISRQEVINAFYIQSDDEGWWTGTAQDVEELLNSLQSTQLKPKTEKWIPVSERLPEKAVLCCDVRGEMLIAYPFKDDDSYTGYSAQMDDYYLIDCIAWMPLPESYKEVSE